MPRSAAAVHLASALAIGSANVTVAVWDKRLHAGAIAAGLAVAQSPHDRPLSRSPLEPDEVVLFQKHNDLESKAELRDSL